MTPISAPQWAAMEIGSLTDKSFSTDTRILSRKNNGANSLHGGAAPFNKVFWAAKETPSADGAALSEATSERWRRRLPRKSFRPRDVHADWQNEFKIEYSANTDKDTVLNLTNHCISICRAKVPATF